jgi:putative DNA primase/helicase
MHATAPTVNPIAGSPDDAPEPQPLYPDGPPPAEPDRRPLDFPYPPDYLTRQSRAAWYFAELTGDRVRYDHGRGRNGQWLTWHGHRWRPDEDGEVTRLWLDMLWTLYRNAILSSGDARARLIPEVQAFGATNAAITAGLDIASSMEPIATKADAWDQDPWALGCENGVVDLRTGLLRDGRPDEMISRSTGIAYDPDATCPRWQRFLSEVFAGDAELADWYGLFIGASLVGVAQEILALHHGLGNNGKSVAVSALRRAFGNYAVVIPVETLVSAKRSAGDATPDLMALRGARLAFTSEPDQAAKLRGGTLKRLASRDMMTGRGLYDPTSTWEPSHTIQLLTNHLPTIDDATDGCWRRIALVPWTVHFRRPGENGDAPPEDPDLAATLFAEAPGILAWAVRGAVAFAAGRTLLPFPTAVRVKTDAYRAEEDKLGAFIAERIVYERGASISQTDLWLAYLKWCEAGAIATADRIGRTSFAREFETRGHGVKRVTGHARNRLFTGVHLATGDDGDKMTSYPPLSVTPAYRGEYTEEGKPPPNSSSRHHSPEIWPDLEDVAPDLEDVAPDLAPDLAPALTVECADYHAHQSSHRVIAGAGICVICHPIAPTP